MNRIRIEDADDPRIAEFTAIRERDLAGRQDRFIAEGRVVLNMLAAAHRNGGGFAVEKVLLLENRVAGLGDILDSLPGDIPVFIASAAVIDAIAGFHLHRGVLALGRRTALPDAATLLAGLSENAVAKNALVVAAFGISNHDNLGAIFRNAAAFGVDAVLLDATCCDPLYRKALRVSVGSVLAVPYARGGEAGAILAALAEAGFAIWGLSPAGGTEIGAVKPGSRMALITGTEGEGLAQSVLDAVATARIAQAPGLDSLNAATATGIALYQIARGMGRIG